MNASARKKQSETDYVKELVIDSTVNNPEFHRGVEKAIDSTHVRVYSVGYPPHASYPPQMYWHNIVTQTQGELQNLGFIPDPEGGNQLRLLSVNGYDCPVRLRFAKGKIKDSTAIFSARKGIETKIGLIQNQQHFVQQQPLFPDLNQPTHVMERELNLWVLYQIQPKFITAWIALCAGFPPYKKVKRAKCEDSFLICSKPKVGSVELPDFLGKIEDGGYDIDLDDKDDFDEKE